MSTTRELRRLGKGIVLLVTRVDDREHALVRFQDEPSEEQRATIQFVNDCLAVKPEYRGVSKHFIVDLESLDGYRRFGFEMVDVLLPRIPSS